MVASKVDESLSLQTLSREKPSRWSRNQKFRENEEAVKNLYSESSLFIGAREQFQENASIRPLWGFRRTRVHSDVLRVTFFYWNSKIFVESDHQSQPASPRG
jgi:hypothetical protein